MADLALPGTPKPKNKPDHPYVKAAKEVIQKATDLHDMIYKDYHESEETMNKASPEDQGMSQLGGKAR